MPSNFTKLETTTKKRKERKIKILEERKKKPQVQHSCASRRACRQGCEARRPESPRERRPWQSKIRRTNWESNSFADLFLLQTQHCRFFHSLRKRKSRSENWKIVNGEVFFEFHSRGK